MPEEIERLKYGCNRSFEDIPSPSPLFCAQRTMIKTRESIVRRQLRPPTKTNDQSIEKEYEEQMKALQIKQKLYALKEAEVRQAVSPTRHEKLKRQEELRQSMVKQLRIQEEEKNRQLEEEQHLDKYNEYYTRFYGPRSSEGDKGREENRKEYLKSLMDENIRLSNLKKEIQAKERQLERELDKIRATTPCTWNKRHYL